MNETIQTSNGEIHFKSYVLLDFATVFHKSEIRDVEITETD